MICEYSQSTGPPLPAMLRVSGSFGMQWPIVEGRYLGHAAIGRTCYSQPQSRLERRSAQTATMTHFAAQPGVCLDLKTPSRMVTASVFRQFVREDMARALWSDVHD